LSAAKSGIAFQACKPFPDSTSFNPGYWPVGESGSEAIVFRRLWSAPCRLAVSAPRHRNAFPFAALRRAGKVRMGKSEVYRQFAAQCLEMARTMDSDQDRTILVEMALLWSRLAEYAMQSAARTVDVDPA